MRGIKYSTKPNQFKVEKSGFRKFNPKNDVIHDAHKKLKYTSKFKRNGDIGTFGNIGTGIISA